MSTETQNYTALLAENAALGEQVKSLTAQLGWFKRQLFGERSEKRLQIDPAVQADLLAGLGVDVPPRQPAAEKEKITYERKKSRKDNCVNDQGLRFDDTVPLETIHLKPELEDGSDPDQLEQLSEKTSFRLAQRPGSYVVLKYVRPVFKRRHTGVTGNTDELISTAAPANELEKSVADVSFLAGMLVDKFTYHLPLYRQHQRLAQCGIELSRTTLTNLAHRAIALLEPVYVAQFEHIRKSRVLAMDETPIKAGRKKKGKMRQAYFWPIYGEADEIALLASSLK